MCSFFLDYWLEERTNPIQLWIFDDSRENAEVMSAVNARHLGSDGEKKLSPGRSEEMQIHVAVVFDEAHESTSKHSTLGIELLKERVSEYYTTLLYHS